MKQPPFDDTHGHRQAMQQTRRRLLWDFARFGVVPVVALWVIWMMAGGGFPWPLIPTLILGGWAVAVYMRFRAMMRELEARARTPGQVYREDAVELPRVRFNESGNLTDSFVRQLYNQEDDDTPDKTTEA